MRRSVFGWGSISGISRYSRQQHVFYNYYISSSNKSVMLFKNTLFWGNNKSLTYFEPEILTSATIASKTLLTGLEVDNKPINIGEKIKGKLFWTQTLHQLTIWNWSMQTVISLSFSIIWLFRRICKNIAIGYIHIKKIGLFLKRVRSRLPTCLPVIIFLKSKHCSLIIRKETLLHCR